MFPVRYELRFYINLLRNSVFKGLIKPYIHFPILLHGEVLTEAEGPFDQFNKRYIICFFLYG
jgi:hypothetical protein